MHFFIGCMAGILMVSCDQYKQLRLSSQAYCQHQEECGEPRFNNLTAGYSVEDCANEWVDAVALSEEDSPLHLACAEELSTWQLYMAGLECESSEEECSIELETVQAVSECAGFE